MVSQTYENRFRHHAIKYIREEFPKQTKGIDDDEINKKIDKDVKKAVFFGLKIETDIMGFIDIMWRLFGKDRNESLPLWVTEILSNEELSPEKKIYFIRDSYCIFEAMRE